MLYKVLSMILGTAGSVAGTALFGPAGGLAGGALGGLLGPKPNLNYDYNIVPDRLGVDV